MRTIVWITISAAVCIGGCGGGDENADPGSGCGGGSATDASTPAGAVQAFFAAVAQKDGSALAGLIAGDCEREFKPLAAGTASPKLLDELHGMFKDASVTGTKVDGGVAVVDVKLPNSRRGKESINLKKEGDAWKIAGF